MLRATTACTFSTSQLPKVVRPWCALCILTSKCASRHNGVHFFDIGTSKSGPTLVCFVHFDFKMCFAGAQIVLGWCSNCARLVLKLCSAGAQIVPGWCSNCARLVLKLCSAGAQIVLGWCSNCAQLVLKLCSAGAQIVLRWCSNCARLVLKLCSAGAQIVLFLWSLWCSFCRPFGPFLARASFFSCFSQLFLQSPCAFFVLFLCFFCV